MTSNPVHLMTVAELQQLPESGGAFTYELHHGELVQVTRPKLKHFDTQRRLRDLLRSHAEPGSLVEIELAFRALKEYELRVADIAYVSVQRWANRNREDYFQGAPDLVVEVLSPSNTAAEMFDKEQICLENGCKEFWLVDLGHRLVKVSTTDGVTITYRTGQQIPLALFGTAKLTVDDIFESVD